MAGSDLAALPKGALDDAAARGGTSLRGQHNGTGLRIGIACALFNGGISMRLLDGALAALADDGRIVRAVTLPRSEQAEAIAPFAVAVALHIAVLPKVCA